MAKQGSDVNMPDEEVAHWPVAYSRAQIKSLGIEGIRELGAGSVGNNYDEASDEFEIFPKHRPPSKRPKAGVDF